MATAGGGIVGALFPSAAAGAAISTLVVCSARPLKPSPKLGQLMLEFSGVRLTPAGAPMRHSAAKSAPDCRSRCVPGLVRQPSAGQLERRIGPQVRGKRIFTRYDRCEFVKCTLLIDHATEQLASACVLKDCNIDSLQPDEARGL
jgi:hypothetical protein